MNDKNYDFQNGFNYCIEKSLHEINKIMQRTYSVNISAGELLLRVKEKIIDMQYLGISKNKIEEPYGIVCTKSDTSETNV